MLINFNITKWSTKLSICFSGSLNPGCGQWWRDEAGDFFCGTSLTNVIDFY